MGRSLKIYWITGPGAHDWAFYPAHMLKERGHQVVIFCPGDSPAAAKAKQEGFPLRIIDFPKKLRDPQTILRTIVKLTHIFQVERPDVVHHCMLPISLWTRTAAWLARVPVRVYKPPSLWDLEIPLYCLIERSTAWMDSTIIASSKALADFYSRSPLTRHKTVLGYYGFPLEPFDPGLDGSAVRAEFGLYPEDLVVGMVAYLVPPIRRFNPFIGIKGHEVLIQAASIVVAQNERVKFLLVGDEPPKPDKGAYTARLKQMVEKIGLAKHVIWTGYRPDIPNILAAMDIVAVPSLSENVGGAVEPLLMGKPVVASQVGGLPDVVIEGETGFLVPPGNPQALSLALLRALSLTIEERRRMGKRGREIVTQWFDIRKTVDQLESLYQQILCKKGPANE